MVGWLGRGPNDQGPNDSKTANGCFPDQAVLVGNVDVLRRTKDLVTMD